MPAGPALRAELQTSLGLAACPWRRPAWRGDGRVRFGGGTWGMFSPGPASCRGSRGAAAAARPSLSRGMVPCRAMDQAELDARLAVLSTAWCGVELIQELLGIDLVGDPRL